MMSMRRAFACTVLQALLATALAATSPACLGRHRHLGAVHTEDHCGMALHAPKVALLFLTRGDMPLEKLWRRWFEEVGDLAFSGCLEKPGSEFLECAHARRGDPIGRQQLYTVRRWRAAPLSAKTLVSDSGAERSLSGSERSKRCARAGVRAQPARLPRLPAGPPVQRCAHLRPGRPPLQAPCALGRGQLALLCRIRAGPPHWLGLARGDRSYVHPAEGRRRQPSEPVFRAALRGLRALVSTGGAVPPDHTRAQKSHQRCACLPISRGACLVRHSRAPSCMAGLHWRQPRHAL